MNISSKKEANAIVVAVSGRLDAATAPEFEKSLSDFMTSGEKNFLFNLSGLEYISSAGLRTILAAAKRLKELNGKLAFSGLQGHVKEVFLISGFNGIFSIYESDAEGLKGL